MDKVIFKLQYQNPADAKDCFNFIDRKVEPDDDIDLEIDDKVVTITTTPQNFRGLRMMLAKIGL